jgi:hypothetical protein
MYRAGRTLALIIATASRALLAAVILTEDLFIQARSWVLTVLADQRARRMAAVAARSAAVARVPGDQEDGALTGRVVPLEELRRSRASRQEPA